MNRWWIGDEGWLFILLPFRPKVRQPLIATTNTHAKKEKKDEFSETLKLRYTMQTDELKLDFGLYVELAVCI